MVQKEKKCNKINDDIEYDVYNVVFRTIEGLLVQGLDRVVEPDPDGSEAHLALEAGHQTVVQAPSLNNCNRLQDMFNKVSSPEEGGRGGMCKTVTRITWLLLGVQSS